MSEQTRSVQHNGAWGAATFGATLALIIGLRLDNGRRDLRHSSQHPHQPADRDALAQ